MVEPTAAVALTAEELDILIDGLDALEYWELGDRLPRNNGEVFIPGDMPPEHDRYWRPEPDPSEDAQEAIEQVRRCRALAHRLRAIERLPIPRKASAASGNALPVIQRHLGPMLDEPQLSSAALVRARPRRLRRANAQAAPQVRRR